MKYEIVECQIYNKGQVHPIGSIIDSSELCPGDEIFLAKFLKPIDIDSPSVNAETIPLGAEVESSKTINNISLSMEIPNNEVEADFVSTDDIFYTDEEIEKIQNEEKLNSEKDFVSTKKKKVLKKKK